MMHKGDWNTAVSGFLIDGKQVVPTGRNAIEVVNPALGEAFASVPSGTAEDIDDAVRAAHRALGSPTWRNLSTADRSSILNRLADLIEREKESLAAIETRDIGMPIAIARTTINTAISVLRYYAGLAHSLTGQSMDLTGDGQSYHAYTRPEPVGVVGIITAWNGPLVLLCNKLAPAIAAGCTCVIKPPELASLSTLALSPLFEEAGFPSGVVNIVTGTGNVAGAALANHRLVAKISFTGSTRTGRELIHASAGNFKRLTLELGGKSPLIIMPDADLEASIPTAALAIFGNAGQACFAASRLFVHEDCYDAVLEGLRRIVGQISMGDTMSESTVIGPLISEAQRARVAQMVDHASVEGAELLVGGHPADGPGYYYTPTIFGAVEPDMQIVREEIFGPVLTVARFNGIEGVVSAANDTDYGLAAGIFTRDISTAHRVAMQLSAGSVWVNCYGRLDAAIPFGGLRQSGWGREFGLQGIESYLETKSVHVAL